MVVYTKHQGQTEPNHPGPSLQGYTQLVLAEHCRGCVWLSIRAQTPSCLTSGWCNRTNRTTLCPNIGQFSTLLQPSHSQIVFLSPMPAIKMPFRLNEHKGTGIAEDEWHLKNDSDGAVLMMTVLLYISGKHKQWDVFNLCSNVNKEQVYILSGGEIKLLLLHNRYCACTVCKTLCHVTVRLLYDVVLLLVTM